MKSWTSFVPLALMFAALAPAAGQSYSYQNGDRSYRTRDYVSPYRDNGYRSDRYNAPSGSYSRYAYRPNYSAPYGQTRQSPSAGLQPIHMYVNPQNGETLLSKGPEQEHADTLAYSYQPEGVRFYLLAHPAPDTVPLYRFNVHGIGHIYGSTQELGHRYGGVSEGALGYMYSQPRSNTIALHAWHDHHTGAHHYTTRTDLSHQYEYLGVVGYVIRA